MPVLSLSDFFGLVDRLISTLDSGDQAPEILRVHVVISLAERPITHATPRGDRDVVRTARWLLAQSRRLAAQVEAAQGSLHSTLAYLRHSNRN